MRPKVFLDTNMVLDFFMVRDPFSQAAQQLFQLRESGKLLFCLSALTLANLAYHANKNGKSPAVIINSLLEWTEVIELDKDIFHQTINSDFKDFEDGLQYFSAVRALEVDVIITRNKKDFAPSKIKVLSPTDFLSQFYSTT